MPQQQKLRQKARARLGNIVHDLRCGRWLAGELGINDATLSRLLSGVDRPGETLEWTGESVLRAIAYLVARGRPEVVGEVLAEYGAPGEYVPRAVGEGEARSEDVVEAGLGLTADVAGFHAALCTAWRDRRITAPEARSLRGQVEAVRTTLRFIDGLLDQVTANER